MLETAQQAISNGIQIKDMAVIESGQVLLQEATARINNIIFAQNKNKIEQNKMKSTTKKRKV